MNDFAMMSLRWRHAVMLIAIGMGGCATLDSTSPTQAQKPTATSETSAADDQAQLIDALKQAIEKGQISEAQFIIRRLRNLRPDQPEAKLADAEISLSKGRYTEAIHQFEHLVPMPDLAARAHQGIGLAMLLAGKTEKAKTHLDKAVKLDPHLWRAWNGLGYYYDSHRRWRQSTESYAHALKIKPRSAIILNNSGFSFLMQGRYGQAAVDFRAALRQDPKLRVAKTNLRVALAWQGKYAEALADTSPETLSQALNNVGYVAMLRGDYTVAEAYFTRAMDASPSYDQRAAANLQQLRALRLNRNVSRK